MLTKLLHDVFHDRFNDTSVSTLDESKAPEKHNWTRTAGKLELLLGSQNIINDKTNKSEIGNLPAQLTNSNGQSDLTIQGKQLIKIQEACIEYLKLPAEARSQIASCLIDARVSTIKSTPPYNNLIIYY
jgi:hypothetical protein